MDHMQGAKSFPKTRKDAFKFIMALRASQRKWKIEIGGWHEWRRKKEEEEKKRKTGGAGVDGKTMNTSRMNSRSGST